MRLATINRRGTHMRTLARVMAKSKYEYVKTFEREPTLLPHCWPVVRLDGKSFTRFCETHGFEKPNDKRGLDLMNAAAKEVMTEFRDVRIAFGESDEFNFVFHKDTQLYGRRSFKLVSLMSSCFAGNYVHAWKEYFPETELQSVPCFDGRIVEYPTERHMKDYLAWRQVDTHINNQYNTCYWALVKSGMTGEEAQTFLKGTEKGAKNALLFDRFRMNYNDLPEQFKKGSVLFWDVQTKTVVVEHVDIIKEAFWDSHAFLLE